MISIIQLSDTHLLDDPKKIAKERAPYEQLMLGLEHVQKTVPDEKIIVVTGDLVTDTKPATYKVLSNVLNQVNSPVYILPGNHDDGEMLRQNIMGANIHHMGEIILNNWLIILLDSSTPGKSLGSGRLSPSELERLETLLQTHPDKSILIFIHHPPILFGAKWFRNICLENKDDFQAILQNRKNVKAVMFGHAHTQYSAFIDNRLYICSPSTWRQMNHSIHDRSEYTDEPGGYNWYQLEESNSLFQFGTHYFPHQRLV